jgi:hypothetical protein
MIKTFRGHLADGGEDKIRLSTKKGKIGYKIIKFQTIGKTLGSTSIESVCQVWKVSGKSTATAPIDFSDGNLLAVAYWKSHGDTLGFQHVLFDQEVFNQDIYVTNQDTAGDDSAINYYIELEVVPLSDNAAAVSTLGDIRMNPQVGA